MNIPLASVILRQARERSVRLRHPWLLSGSIERVDGNPEPGGQVRVLTADGRLLAHGDFDPDSQIRVRLTHFGDAAPDPEETWFEERLLAALAWREEHPLLAGTDAVRWVHAEADGLPGLTVDRYARWIAIRPATAAMARRAERTARALLETRELDGAWLRGPTREDGTNRSLGGSVPEEPIEIQERGRRYQVDLRRGQKTGFYLDQRDSRDRFERLAEGARVLDLYAYSGGFATAALAGGARVAVCVESSKPAGDLLARNAPEAERIAGDVGAFLREDRRHYDLVAIDPPPFAKRKRDAGAACRAYQELHQRAFARVAPGGQVLTFCCSHHVDAARFRQTIFTAAAQAGIRIQVLEALGAPPDHPVDLNHPQGEYLKGFLLRVGDRNA